MSTAPFSENHDQPRIPSMTSDEALTKNMIMWGYVGDGVPITYYGQEQNFSGGADPANREACVVVLTDDAGRYWYTDALLRAFGGAGCGHRGTRRRTSRTWRILSR